MKNQKKIFKWYYEIKLSIELLEAFINSVENQIKSSIQNFIDKKETLIINEQPDLHYAQFVDIHNGLDSVTWNLEGIFKEHFPNMQRKSALISLYSFLEFELDNLCALLKKQEGYKIDFKDIKGKGIERSILYLKKVANLQLDKGDSIWLEVINIQKIRNLIVHNNSKLKLLDGKQKEDESQYIKGNIFLSGESEIIINKGFLTHVLKSFNELFKKIDSLIQKKYNKII